MDTGNIIAQQQSDPGRRSCPERQRHAERRRRRSAGADHRTSSRPTAKFVPSRGSQPGHPGADAAEDRRLGSTGIRRRINHLPDHGTLPWPAPTASPGRDGFKFKKSPFVFCRRRLRLDRAGHQPGEIIACWPTRSGRANRRQLHLPGRSCSRRIANRFRRDRLTAAILKQACNSNRGRTDGLSCRQSDRAATASVIASCRRKISLRCWTTFRRPGGVYVALHLPTIRSTGCRRSPKSARFCCAAAANRCTESACWRTGRRPPAALRDHKFSQASGMQASSIERSRLTDVIANTLDRARRPAPSAPARRFRTRSLRRQQKRADFGSGGSPQSSGSSGR